MNLLKTLLISLTIGFLSACGGSSDNSGTSNNKETSPSRSFLMGFTPWPYAATLNAQATTYQRIDDHGDIIKHHLQAGIPWQEAYDESVYPAAVEQEISGRLNNTPIGHEVFLAIDSLNTARDALADNWGANTNEARTGVWAMRSWNSPEVIDAYLNFAIDMIERFQPGYFEYGTEISELIINDLAGYQDYLVFAEQVYTTLSARYPDLKLLTSIALKSPGNAEMSTITTQYASLLPYTDVVGISVYPYVFFDHSNKGDPANLPSDWLSQIQTLSGNKELAISETGWIAEDLTIPTFGVDVQSDSEKQNAYAETLLQASYELDMAFVLWWTVSDFDTLWTDTLGEDPLAQIWRDIGLYDENQNARTALTTWDQWLQRPVE